ncbi:hypothetical protein NPIL_324431 [Nephila pilipes]|uniref:Uncharacterized protein n=1 Tax=Nephila pilipes TaxID=299642 RepID=A0A8X6IXM3_NEPPI|nr:hypothetical protein NPIL_324431 [Nephila pilipes]
MRPTCLLTKKERLECSIAETNGSGGIQDWYNVRFTKKSWFYVFNDSFGFQCLRRRGEMLTPFSLQTTVELMCSPLIMEKPHLKDGRDLSDIPLSLSSSPR